MADNGATTSGSSPRIQLLINDAHREFEESGKVRNLPFWVYLITCRTNLPKYGDASGAKSQDGYTIVKVWRRYSDFQWLRSKLFKMYGGHIIPPIPEKDFFGTLDKVADLVSGPEVDDWRLNDFVSLRLGALNKFVHALARAPVADSDLVRNFICLSRQGEWQAYKQHVSDTLKQQAAASGETIGVASMRNMIGKMKDLVKRGKNEGHGGSSVSAKSYPNMDPRVLRIETQSHEFEGNLHKLYIASMNLLTRGKSRPKVAQVVYDTTSDPAKETVPMWLLSVGHKVCSVEGHVGTVRFIGAIEESTGTSTALVGIEWPDATGNCDGVAPDGSRYFKTEPNHASFVLPQVVFYPPNGISDPVILGAREASSQIETQLLPYGSRVQQLLTELVDLTYFWRMYAVGLNEVIEYLIALESTRQRLQEDVDKESRPERLRSLRDRLDATTKTLKDHTNTFCEQFKSNFQPDHRRAMQKILDLYVAVQKELCIIGASWNKKMQPILGLLDISRTHRVDEV